MIFGLGWPNWTRLGVWLVLGMFVYFGYGRRHSKLGKELASEVGEAASIVRAGGSADRDQR